MINEVKLPKYINPFKAAQKKSFFDGIILKSDLSRLKEVVVDLISDLKVHIVCEIDLQNQIIVNISGSTVVLLECQRCQNLFEYALAFKQAFILRQQKISSDEDDTLLVLNELGELDVIQTLEDECLLELPTFPKHEMKDCSIQFDLHTYGEIAVEEPQEHNSPFNILEKLKK